MHLNFQQLHGVSTSKGCYIGQELINRTVRTGVIRKHALPFLVQSLPDFKFNPDQFMPMQWVDREFKGEELIGMEVRDGKGGKIGKVLGAKNNVGTAIIDMPKMIKAAEKSKEGENAKYFIKDKPVIMWNPPWLTLEHLSDNEDPSKPKSD